MHSWINVVVTCTARKSLPVPGHLRLRRISADTVEEKFEKWINALEANGGQVKPAIEMYCGGAWSVIRSLAKDPTFGPKLRIWVISAGQGLLEAETAIPSYSATFSPGHKDSIWNGKKSTSLETWWQLLTDWRQETGQKIFSLAEIARQNPSKPLIVALSRDYLNAVNADLLSALGHLRNRDQLVVICAGAEKKGELETNFLPCDARFENLYKCCRTDINAKLLAAIVRKYEGQEISAAALQKDFAAQLKRLPQVSYPKRIKSDDSAIRAFILEWLKWEPNVSHTICLRGFRSVGLACEQHRFRRLFRSARKSSIKYEKSRKLS